jgi:formate hydrogenlyase subunit 4
MVFALGVNMLLAQNDSASRMEWAVLSWIMISVLIGWQAHFTKGRMAKGWGFLTFVVLVIFHIMFSRTTAGLQRIPEEPEMIGEKEFAMIAMVFGGPVMSLIVWRLPKLHRPDR